MNNGAFFADVKRLYREPVLVLFMCVPVFALIAIKLLAAFGFPVIYSITGFDISPYLGYIEAFSILLSPGMLGTVAAFLMIDERDEGIYDLMSVTPLGFTGYIANRLMMPFILSAVYTILSHIVLNLYSISVLKLLLIAGFSGIQCITLGLALFSLANDKVQGLTYTKLFNVLMITALSDLLGIKWISIISSLCPYYWTSYAVTRPFGALSACAALAVHLIWLSAAAAAVMRRR